MSWIEKKPPCINKTGNKHVHRIQKGLWAKCASCSSVLYAEELAANLYVCLKCNYHMRMRARARIEMLLDIDDQVEIGKEICSCDPLGFKDTRTYPERIQDAFEKTGESEAIIVVKGFIKKMPTVVSCFEFNFLGGSMGSAVGEKFVQGVQAAINQNSSFVNIAASGGARMQESVFSLMQMAKTNAILTKLSSAKLPFISVLTDPTMGGVSASFAFMGDIVIAEPKALIGFAGPRVIAQTVREKLPEGFQSSEFLLEKGAIDKVVDRRQLREEIATLLSLLTR